MYFTVSDCIDIRVGASGKIHFGAAVHKTLERVLSTEFNDAQKLQFKTIKDS